MKIMSQLTAVRFGSTEQPVRWSPLGRDALPGFLAKAELKGVGMDADVLTRIAQSPLPATQHALPSGSKAPSTESNGTVSDAPARPARPLGRDLAMRLFGTPLLKCDVKQNE
jgi:hypothetical protein